MPPTAGGGIVRLAMARVTATGVDPEPLLRKAGLTLAQVLDRDARIGVRHQIQLLDLVAGAVGDDRLGFHLAERFDLREIGLLYYVLASSMTLGEALARIERYSTVTNEGIEVRCRIDGELRAHVNYVGVPRHADCHQMEFWATAFVRVCRYLTGTDLKPVRVRLAHPHHGPAGELDAFFGCKIAFGADGDEIVFARAASQLSLTGADPYLNELLVKSCEEILARRCTPVGPVRAHVENVVAPLLPHGRSHVATIARTLGMSRRTLARRLAAEGVTFTEIVEEMRRDLAHRYLGDASLSVSQIAWLLGFQEVSAFTAACKRWTGATPTQVRTQSALAAASM
jgi:AraC-like DNA-binding protein